MPPSTPSSEKRSPASSQYRRNRAATMSMAAHSTSAARMLPKLVTHLRSGLRDRHGKVLQSRQRWQQFGGSLGGPIIKNKLFIFGDFQGSRQESGLTQSVTVPTLTALQSCNPATNAASSTPGFCNLAGYIGNVSSGGQAFDPATGNPDGTGRTAFTGNLIPINRISPQAAAFFAKYPAPNATGNSGGTQQNFIAAGAGPYNQNAFDTRIDYNVAPSVQMFGRFSLDYFSLSGKGVLGALGGVGFGPGGLAGSSIVHNYSLASGVTKTFSPTLLADFRFGYFKYNPKTNKPDAGTK